MTEGTKEVAERVEEELPERGSAPSEIVLATEMLPSVLPLLPIRPRPFFPGVTFPVEVRGEGQMAAVAKATDSDENTVGLVLVRNLESEDGPENLFQVGVAAKVLKVIRSEDNHLHVLLNCLQRFSVHSFKQVEALITARVEYHSDPKPTSNSELEAYTRAIFSTLRKLGDLDPMHSEGIKLFLSRSSMDQPGPLADFAAALTSADGVELQEILETFDIRERVEKVLVLLKKELEVSRLQHKITKQIEEKISAQQREFFLKEQLKAIKKELGLEKDSKSAELEMFKERLKKLHLSEQAEKVVSEEMEKLSVLEPASPEYHVTRNYLDWLTVLPWGKLSEDQLDLERAKSVLDRDHYGLEDVKNRILEFIAVGQIKGEMSGSILCLIGPPGVGKTSVGRSIAEALGRRFYGFSLGGMRDEAEIKGHRRTYIGAMPGKCLQAMKTVGTSNPVIMLDEIDKIGASFHGDPASALLEVLDPEQNRTFRDHYLDVPFDLSSTVFVATGNQLDTIPEALLDRMEVIRLSGYIREEKVEIASKYLIPKALKEYGLKRSQASILKGALVGMIEGYAREAGVRNLENLIKKTLRKSLLELLAEQKERVVVRKADLERYLGKPVFEKDDLVEGQPGVVTGLAWTPMGGVTLQVEATAVASKRKGFQQTGQLGQVMVESSEIAYSYVMARLKELGVQSDYFDHHFVHLHVPAGATPKDGPSAGITMATALVSIVSNRKPRKRMAMTGELTLTGRVLPIGGVKEKVIAARRSGRKDLILPKGNEKDVLELPDYLKKELEFHFARDFDEVLSVAFKSG